MTVAAAADTALPPGQSRWRLIAQGLFGEPELESHHQLAYDFSIGPWRLMEYFWANIGGRMFPIHHRWMSLLPGEGRVWTPTLYMGLLPAVLAIWQLRFRRGDSRQIALSVVIAVFALGSFGYYGLGWMAAELQGFFFGQQLHQTWWRCPSEACTGS